MDYDMTERSTMNASGHAKGRARPAVFLDRDGTLIEDCGDLTEPSHVAFFEDTVPSLRRLNEHFDLFIVTNQSGVAKGNLSMADVDRVNSHVSAYLEAHGVPILATYVCPHQRSDQCRCIKPEPYFLLRAREQFGINLPGSFTVGDHPHDVALAERVGGTGIYVLTGHGVKHRSEVAPGTIIKSGIKEAAEYILAHATDGQA